MRCAALYFVSSAGRPDCTVLKVSGPRTKPVNDVATADCDGKVKLAQLRRRAPMRQHAAGTVNARAQQRVPSQVCLLLVTPMLQEVRRRAEK